MKLLAIILIILGIVFAIIAAVALIQSIRLGNQYLKNEIKKQEEDRKK